MKTYLIALSALTAALTSGCVMGTRTIELNVPKAASYPNATDSFSIGEIRDSRTFQNKPRSPSTPSIDGDVTVMTPATRALMIGRQRDGFGKAMGDVALPTGTTVMAVTKDLVAESLKRHGYSVTDSPASGNVVAVDIHEFWAWFSPGFASVSFEARIDCTLSITRKSDSKVIKIQGYGINKGQMASDANWQLAYQRAFDDFISKSAPELKKAGL